MWRGGSAPPARHGAGGRGPLRHGRVRRGGEHASCIHARLGQGAVGFGGRSNGDSVDGTAQGTFVELMVEVEIADRIELLRNVSRAVGAAEEEAAPNPKDESVSELKLDNLAGWLGLGEDERQPASEEYYMGRTRELCTRSGTTKG